MSKLTDALPPVKDQDGYRDLLPQYIDRHLINAAGAEQQVQYILR